ncbi:MAG: zf-TFIIB domain-containing protein [Oligoflexus sp.]|nr:zf-TFIIB domain-containing protein [Oligoflexus sp.]
MDFSFANARPEKAYFYKVNQELIKALHEKELQQLDHHIQELHYMKCPKCGHDLRHTKFGEMVVDRCTSCEGVFFDKDEFSQLFGEPDSHESFINTLHTLLVGDNPKT